MVAVQLFNFWILLDTVNKSLMTDCLISVHVNDDEYDHTSESMAPSFFLYYKVIWLFWRNVVWYTLTMRLEKSWHSSRARPAGVRGICNMLGQPVSLGLAGAQLYKIHSDLCIFFSWRWICRNLYHPDHIQLRCHGHSYLAINYTLWN